MRVCVVLFILETFPVTFSFTQQKEYKLLMWLIYLISILIKTRHCKNLEDTKLIPQREENSLELMPGYRVNEPWLGITLELSHNSSRVEIPHFGAIIFGRFALPKKLVLPIFLEKDWKFLCHYHNIFWVYLCSIGLGKFL